MSRKLFLVTSIALLICNLSYAGHNETRRKNCSFINAKYKAEAHAGQCAFYNRNVSKGCNGPYEANASYDNNCVKAYSKVGSSISTGGFTINCTGQCYWGGYISSLSQELGFEFETSDGNTPDEDREGINNEVYYKSEFVNISGKRYLRLYEISVNLKFDSYISNKSNSLTFSLHETNPNYYHNDDSSEIIYDDEILFQTKVELSANDFIFNNRQKNISKGKPYLEEGVNVEGIFLQSDFTFIIDSNNYTHLTYTGPSEKIIALDDYYTSDNSWDAADLAISSVGDCKPHEEAKFSQREQMNNTTYTDVSVVPIPATDKVTIHCGKYENPTITIYNINGQILPLPITQISTNSFLVELNRVAEGVYYVLIRSGEEKILKKIVKN